MEIRRYAILKATAFVLVEEESYENVEEMLKIVIQYASRKEWRLFYIFMADIYEIPKSKVSEKLCLA